MTETEEIAPYTLPRYTRQWVYTFLVLIAGFTIYFKIQYPLVSKPTRSSDAVHDAQETFWFFVLQLPNPDAHYSQGELYRKSLDWFNALRLAGFHPMLLSELRARMAKGMLLPEKTIVLSIDEALLTTYNAYEPLLKDFKFPAVLVASEKPLRDGDRGYLSSNAVEKLPDNGAWDVILLNEHASPQLLAPQEVPMALPLPPGNSPWSARADRSLANQLPDLRKPRRLSIDWQWSGQDVVNRLQAETPVHPHGSHLGVRPIMGHPYGVVLSRESSSEDRFSLAAPSDQRGADIGWLGTRGLQNYEIHFSLEDATGQVCFFLRSTSDGRDTIRVAFFDGKVTIKEQINGQERLLGMTDWPRVFPWKGIIQLRGTELSVIANDKTIMVSRVSLRPSHRSTSILQMMVYDQLYGAAQAKNISLEISPVLSSEADLTEEAQ